MSSLQEQHSFSKQYGSCTFIPSQKKWPYQVGGGPEPEVPSMEPEVTWMEFGSHVSEQTDRRMPHLALRSQEFVTNIFSEGSKIFHPKNVSKAGVSILRPRAISSPLCKYGFGEHSHAQPLKYCPQLLSAYQAELNNWHGDLLKGLEWRLTQLDVLLSGPSGEVCKLLSKPLGLNDKSIEFSF